MRMLGTTKVKKAYLSTLAHRQTMELLRLGDKSLNPAIAEAAVEIAKEREKNFHSAASQVPTRTTAILVTIVIVAAIALCWYVLLSYQSQLADRLVALILGGAIAIVVLYLLIYGHLTQENFMTIVGWFKEHFQRSKPASSGSAHSGTPLDATVSAAAEKKDDRSRDE